MASAVFHNGRFFQADSGGANHSFASCVVVDTSSSIITHVGHEDDEQVTGLAPDEVRRHDMGGRVVLPGFIDGHMHLLMTGQSLQKCGLEHCQNLDDIRAAITAFARAHPKLPRIMCKGWMHFMTRGKALASMLDDIDDPRPIFIDSKDLHSAWCNSAALEELGVMYDVPDPEGGKIHRDPETGRASGYLTESAAVVIVWPHLAKVASMQEKTAAIRAAVDAYNAEGYTGVVEMAMDENAWEALQQVLLSDHHDRDNDSLPMRFAVHWLITPRKTEAETLAQVDRAVELNRQFNTKTSPDCRVVGIKIICDGIVDGCTAALLEPYAADANQGTQGIMCDPIWSPEQLAPVVRKADAAGLQCALHAIGDKAVRNAIDALEQVASASHETNDSNNNQPPPPPPRQRRHRIEHLELTSPQDAARLGNLGITASIQPVHADPSILRAWPPLLGPGRCGRAFAYKEFADHGAVLALGSDSPTAPHAALKNMYTATTRRSAREPRLEDTVNPHFAIDLAAAVSGATRGGAYSCFAEGWTGSVEVGKSADFAVVDMQWDKERLLDARVVQTWFKGQKVFG